MRLTAGDSSMRCTHSRPRRARPVPNAAPGRRRRPRGRPGAAGAGRAAGLVGIDRRHHRVRQAARSRSSLPRARCRSLRCADRPRVDRS
ncbi:hypothetical protein G6F65_022586 [Rhizopus arrhizus]|nr:hypothetical protein G6F65_022586 [Rhizopus arrhizus]